MQEKFKGDKRTKEYRDWKEAQKTKGLGDLVSDIAKKTGVDKLAKAVLGEDCGCEERRKALNKIVRFKSKECLKDEDYKMIGELLPKLSNPLPYATRIEMVKLYNQYFIPKENEKTTCSSCLKKVKDKLTNVYNYYKKNIQDD